MAWYEPTRKGGYDAYGRHEPDYDRRAYPDHVQGYEYHNAQSYVQQTAEVVEYRLTSGPRGSLGLTGHNQLSPKGSPKHQGGPGNKTHFVPWKTTSDRAEHDRESSPKHHNQVPYEKSKGSSARYNTHQPNNPTHGGYNSSTYSKPRHHSTYGNPTSDDDDSESDEECEDGVCYPNPKRNGSDGKPKPKVHYRPSTEDRPYYEEKPKVPYDRPSQYANKPFTNTPSKVKTKPDYATRNGEHPSKFNGSPRNDERYAQTIDSSEAKKRYGGVTVPAERLAEQKYEGTIDCRTAAEKYRGIFVPNNNF